MVSWPPPGTRVTVRYRRPQGSVPPLTDAVGHLLEAGPVVRVRTKTGAVAEFARDDAVALRVLTDAPVRTSDIRALEHAAAAACPGVERDWVDGWLLRSDPGAGLAANSAVPLDLSANLNSAAAIVDWYDRRGLTSRLAIPDRLLRVPPGLPCEHTERVLVRDIAPVGEAVRSGEDPGGPEARAVVTDAPDGVRWVGLSVCAADDPALAPLCGALLGWGAARGATRAYLVAPDADNALADALGFRLHHRRRYFPAVGTV